MNREVRRVVLVAGGSTDAAEEHARAAGFEPVATLTKDDILAAFPRLRAALGAPRADGIAIWSPDWERQPNPQVYELALAAAPVKDRYLLDAATGTIHRLTRTDAMLRVGRGPLDVVAAAAYVAAEGTVFFPPCRRTTTGPVGRWNSSRSILAVWVGERQTVGGAITHAAGILGGFRRAGFRVILIATAPPPAQLAAITSDVELVPNPPAAARLTSDIEAIHLNRRLRPALKRLVDRLQPAFVYQRHRTFLVGCADAAVAAGVPLVLEWNGSETWIRDHWVRPLRLERTLDPLATAMERHVVERAAVVAAVSEPAARMAEAAGGMNRVLVVPNGVDVAGLDAALQGASRAPRDGNPRVGWIGTFGSWHGADVLVRALPFLADAELVMVGDGDDRPACQELARSLGVFDRIRWRGILEHGEALRELSGCDVLASPHVPMDGQAFFGSPTKLFEYMALGKPIVASRLEQLGEVLCDGVNARLVPPADPGALAAALAEILSCPDEAAALGRQARLDAVREHTWDQRVEAILARLERTA